MHNPSFDVVSIERPSNFVVDLVVDERNAERELVSRSFVRFCPRVPAVHAFNLLDHVGGVSVVNQLGYRSVGGASDVFHAAVCFGALQLILYNGDLR